jgi:hypothetical protein
MNGRAMATKSASPRSTIRSIVAGVRMPPTRMIGFDICSLSQRAGSRK